MTDLVRVKRGRHPWVTEPESGGGGGGSEDLATVLSNGNDGGGQQIKNIATSSDPGDAVNQTQLDVAFNQNLSDILSVGNNANGTQVKNIGDGTDPQDAVTLAQLEAASVPGLDAVVAVNGNANGHDIQSVANMQAATINVIGGDDSGPVAKITPPVGATQSVAEIGPQNLGLIVGPDGSVQNRADDTAPASIVAMQRGADAVYIDIDGVHITGLVNSGGSISILYAYPFDQDDGAAARTLFTPDVAGEVITFVGWTNAVGWDGTTPILGFGQGVADGDFGISQAAAALDSPAPNVGGAQQIFQGPTAGAGWLLQDLPFMLWVTQDGKKAGANPGSTDSTGILYVVRHKL